MDIFYVEKRKMPKIEPSWLKLCSYPCFWGNFHILENSLVFKEMIKSLCAQRTHCTAISVISISIYQQRLTLALVTLLSKAPAMK